jgi:hypothetical protein
MDLSATQRAEIANDLEKFVTALKLSEQQKERLRMVLTGARQRIEQYKQENPNVSKAQVLQQMAASRSSIRERVLSILTAHQLTKWDAAVDKANKAAPLL